MRVCVLLIYLLVIQGCKEPTRFYESVESIPVNMEPAIGADTIREASPNSFDRHFTRTREIALSDEVILGGINLIKIGPSGQILVIEQGNQNAFLYDSEGTFLNKLNPDSCHPGFTWRPNDAAFRPDGSFLVFNNAPGGFYFNGSGECLYPFDVERFPPIHFAIDPTTMDVLMVTKRSDTRTVIRTDSTGQNETILYSSGFPVTLSRMRMGGFALDSKGNTLHYFPHSPFLYRLSNDGKGYEKIGANPPSFIPLPADFTTEEVEDTDRFMKRYNKWFSNYSMGNGFYDMGDGTLLLMHFNGYVSDKKSPETNGLHIVDFDGNSILGEEIFAGDKRIIAAGNGAVYGQGKAASNSEERLNPTLIEYKLNRK